MAKNDTDNPLALDQEVRENKREDAENRQQERREQGLVRSFDRDDKHVGWDAQQGALPNQSNEDDPRRQAHLYDEDPVRYRKDQLPEPDVLSEAGYRPVISRNQVENEDDDVDATLQDGGPQTANIQDDEVKEPVELENEDAPRTVEDDAAKRAEDEGGKGKKKSSKKSTKKKS